MESSSTTLATSPNPSNLGQIVTLTATIDNVTNPSHFVPTGTVTFTDLTTNTQLGSVLLNGATGPLQKSIQVSSLSGGNHSLQASFSGGNYIAPGAVATTVSGSNSNTVQQTVNAVATTTSLTSSRNPSSVGQPVTFTASVTGSSPTGTVTFFDGGTQIGSATVAGGAASLTTSSLAAGSHSITVHYRGDANNAASVSAVLVQTVSGPGDSVKLRETQVSVMPIAANISGQAITGAVGDAIGVGFGGSPASLALNGGGFTYYFGADSQIRNGTAADDDGLKRFLASSDGHAHMVDNGFSALGYAGLVKAAPSSAGPSTLPRDWLAWIDVRGTGYDQSASGNDLKGIQVNAVAGVTRRFTSDFLLGAFVGYERFDFSSMALSGQLDGNGWTAGAYLGWRIAPQVRFDAMAGWTALVADDAAGAASGSFSGGRWLTSTGLTGGYPWQSLVLEPSARVFALFEHDNGYADSLGVFQAERDFSTGRASAGMKAIYPLDFPRMTSLLPYAGLYGDYYFSSDNAATAGLTTVPLLQGWSARATAGLALSFHGGPLVGIGAEYGGIGSGTQIWSGRARASIPF